MIEQTALAKWAEFNRLKWKCDVDLLQFQPPKCDDFYSECLLFSRYGKFYFPPQNPYQSVIFHATPSAKPFRTNKQWHEVAKLMIEHLVKLRGAVTITLPPDITDVRPFTWRGFQVDIRYTYILNLPYSVSLASKAIRNKIKKANARGYSSKRTENMKHVYECLLETERRQGFSHQITAADLELAQSILGEDSFRCYVCYSERGEPVSANVTLLLNPGQAIGWVAGTKTDHLSNGVVQQLQLFEFEDLASQGVKHFDFSGANIASVAESKADWGGDLTPYYVVRKPGFKDILRSGRDWLQFRWGSFRA